MRRFIAILLLSISTLSFAQQSADPEGHQWWQHAVFYEIYPRSFADTNNDGIGDLRGIDSKLDYLQWLGVTAIWITPMFPSPQVDFGYDVSDYENVDPVYGSLADMDRIITHGKQKNVRVILDLVVNHTSDKHPWFVESASSKNNPKSDWYIWHDGKNGEPPNTWTSHFGGSAWKFVPSRGQYYYHYFYAGQPDLNWRNPEVEKAMFDVTRWWYERGVAGFRLDAVDTMFEDVNLRDNPPVDNEKNAYGDQVYKEIYNKKLPELHGALQRLRKVADEYGSVLIGETLTSNIEELNRYYGPTLNEIQLPMNFMFMRVDKLSAPEFRKQIAWADGVSGWPVWVMSNHDIPRVYDRYGNGRDNDKIAKLMAALYLTLRGTPILYYGEEIGMENNDPKRREDVQDPIGRLGWPQKRGRDGERTPMQWNASKNAGFSEAKPWNPVGPRYAQYNVEAEQKDPASILNWYRKIISLRSKHPALLEGKYVPLKENDPNVLAFLRSYKNKNVVVVLNMSGAHQKAKLNLAAKGVKAVSAKVLATTGKNASSSANAVELEPYGVWIAEVPAK
ncbi:MAG TPA: alpha-glucosidase [Terriglobales bacterium]|nr:alpha-glucosidase [Terriglobales bacterium]